MVLARSLNQSACRGQIIGKKASQSKTKACFVPTLGVANVICDLDRFFESVSGRSIVFANKF
jgi:hypothetical protein